MIISTKFCKDEGLSVLLKLNLKKIAKEIKMKLTIKLVKIELLIWKPKRLSTDSAEIETCKL